MPLASQIYGRLALIFLSLSDRSTYSSRESVQFYSAVGVTSAFDGLCSLVLSSPRLPSLATCFSFFLLSGVLLSWPFTLKTSFSRTTTDLCLLSGYVLHLWATP